MRHKENAVLRYFKYLPCTLSDVAHTKDGIYYSLITDLTLKEFIVAREDHCERNHLVSCKECTNLTDAVKQIDDSGIVPLRSLFASHFLSQGAKYKSDKAIRRILQLLVAIFPLELQKGQIKLFVTELNTAVNYEKLGEFLRTVSVSTDCNTQFPIISRETLKIVCDLASSEKDKRLIKYAVSCGGNMSREAAKKKYGISDLTLLKNTVENAIEQAREIRDAVDHLSNVKEDCILEELGIFCGNDSKSDSDESESSDDETSENGSDTGCPDDVDSENNGQNSDVPPNSSALDPDVIMKGMATVSPAPGNEHLLMLLRENNHNWFSFVGELKMLLHMYTPEVLKDSGFCSIPAPDAHWSSSFYKGLDKIQLEDGRDKCIINRDDAAGFRLDTTYTHKQYKAISDANQQEVTTRTDYVNKYASILQVTSYLVPGTKTTPQYSAGIVKAHIVYPKDPSQHAADVVMLENEQEFKPCMKKKPIDCIRVDGAADEGPSHKEVQFMWTERHLEQEKVCTLVTTRCSGSSYLNRVELQNGCLSVAHGNIFIPSTIHGSNFGKNGSIDYEKLERNLDAATDVYISK